MQTNALATDWLTYANQNATRSLPLADPLVQDMAFLPEMGLGMRVFSGGQYEEGQGPRTGSTRHDHGNAADVFFYDLASGRTLDWSNPDDLPLFQDIVRRARENGVTGFGAGDGYMQPGSMHIGYGAPAVWGAGGSGENAPDWLVAAFNGTTGPVDQPYSPQNGTQAPSQWTGGTPFNPNAPPPNALAAQQQALAMAQLRQREGYRNALMESLQAPIYANQLQGVR